MAKTDTIYNSKNAEYAISSPASAEVMDSCYFMNNADYSYLKYDLEYKNTAGSVIITTKIYTAAGVLTITDTNTLAVKLAWGAIAQQAIDISTLSSAVYKLEISVQGTGVELRYINYHLV